MQPHTLWRVAWHRGLEPNGYVFIRGLLERGSSGSPFINNNRRVIGQAVGIVGNPSCCMQTPVAYYGRFDVSWTGSITATQAPDVRRRLNYWLAPPAFGAAPMVLDGLEGTHPLVISGPASICRGVANAVFRVQHIPANSTVRWRVEHPLAIVGASNEPTVTIRHTGFSVPVDSRIRADIVSASGGIIHTMYHYLVVNIPLTTTFVAPSSIRAGQMTRFTLYHETSLMQAHHHTWSVTPSQNVFMSLWNPNDDLVYISPYDNTINFRFMIAGNYTVRVTARNACGVETRNANVAVTGTVLGAWCQSCGFSPLQDTACPFCVPSWWSSDIEEEEEQQQE